MVSTRGRKVTDGQSQKRAVGYLVENESSINKRSNCLVPVALIQILYYFTKASIQDFVELFLLCFLTTQGTPLQRLINCFSN